MRLKVWIPCATLEGKRHNGRKLFKVLTPSYIEIVLTMYGQSKS